MHHFHGPHKGFNLICIYVHRSSRRLTLFFISIAEYSRFVVRPVREKKRKQLFLRHVTILFSFPLSPPRSVLRTHCTLTSTKLFVVVLIYLFFIFFFNSLLLIIIAPPWFRFHFFLFIKYNTCMHSWKINIDRTFGLRLACAHHLRMIL